MADVVEDVLASAAREVITIAGEANVLAIPTDVSNIDDVVRLRDKVYEAWGEVSNLPVILIPNCVDIITILSRIKRI
jgi:hypothetical protein